METKKLVWNQNSTNQELNNLKQLLVLQRTRGVPTGFQENLEHTFLTLIQEGKLEGELVPGNKEVQFRNLYKPTFWEKVVGRIKLFFLRWGIKLGLVSFT